jgi:hypothetical protein
MSALRPHIGNCVVTVLDRDRIAVEAHDSGDTGVDGSFGVLVNTVEVRSVVARSSHHSALPDE